MHTSPAIDAAPQFMAVVQDGQVPTDAALTGALGRRIAAYHVTADAEPSDGDLEAPPREGGPDLFRRAVARFPDYSLYPLADPADGSDAKLG
ncbi:hypothetical protein SAMN05428984_2302 [Sphingomonas sp. OK281]|nr:hypothetical protein SAMN05428984_2302 [Sphingomonas sp. OK281]